MDQHARSTDAKLNAIISDYDRYREARLSDQYFKHRDILALLTRLGQQSTALCIEKIGHSFERRDIYHIRFGRGQRHLLFWSQMHGNEPTATAALFDLLNFFTSEGHEHPKRLWLDELSLHFVPMLNPDGAERFQRRNAQGIDINRDALQLQSPEGRILKSLVDRWQPEFSFNLHDQNRSNSAGYSANPATLSFLAPAINAHKDIDPVRLKAIQLIGLLNQALSPYAAGHTAKYGDEFEPRAFGENIQRWGSSTLLIESGGFANDPHRQTARRLNFIAYLISIDAIAHNRFQDYDPHSYEAIPYNNQGHFDIIIRNAHSGTEPGYRVDIAINRDDIDSQGSIAHHNSSGQAKGFIADIGDLSTFHGYCELDATGLRIQPTSGGGPLAIDSEACFSLSDGKRVYYTIADGEVTTHAPAISPRP